MGIVDDVLSMQKEMAHDRAYFEDAWRDCADLVAPYASHRFEQRTSSISTEMTGLYRLPNKTTERSRTRYDSTAAWASDRLVAGMESLVVPRAQKWHGLSIDDPFAEEPSDIEEEWLDSTRDYLFQARYDARANFALAAQKAIRSTTVFGTGVLYSEENMGRKGIDPVKAPFFYRHVPMSDIYLGIDAFDDVDKAIRVVDMSARAASDYFGEDNLSERVKALAKDEKKQETTVTFIHAVFSRENAGEYKNKRTDQPYASIWAEVETRHLVKHSGFYTFPYHVMWWDQSESSPYGQSPVMAILSDIKMLQHMRKSALQAAQQMVKPPLGTMPGIYNKRLNLNPGAVNPGTIDENGRQKVQPLLTGQNPSFAERLIEQERQGINEALYIPLFQTLVDNPQMTATEALIRNNEKGELLGPAGAKMESGLARCVDREVDIIQRKGAFEDGSRLTPPPSLIGKNVDVKFTGPLSRLRRMQELQGVRSVIEMAGAMGEYKPEILERIDGDATLELNREIAGAPRKMFHTDEEVAGKRQARAQAQEAQASAMLMEQMAGAAGKATPALQAMQQANAGR